MIHHRDTEDTSALEMCDHYADEREILLVENQRLLDALEAAKIDEVDVPHPERITEKFLRSRNAAIQAAQDFDDA